MTPALPQRFLLQNPFSWNHSFSTSCGSDRLYVGLSRGAATSQKPIASDICRPNTGGSPYSAGMLLNRPHRSNQVCKSLCLGGRLHYGQHSFGIQEYLNGCMSVGSVAIAFQKPRLREAAVFV